MNKLQKEQYQKELKAMQDYFNKHYPGAIDDKYNVKKLKKAARMIVLRNTFLYRIKRFFIFTACRKRQQKKTRVL